MRLSDVCYDYSVGLYTLCEGFHFTRTRYTGLYHSKTRGGIKFPHRQRHANLRVEAAWRTGYVRQRFHELENPLLESGLAPASGYGENPSGESVPASGHLLESFYGVGNNEEIGIGTFAECVRHAVHNKITHAPRIEVSYKAVTVIAFGGDSEKQGILGRLQRPRVDEEVAYHGSVCRSGYAERRGNISNRKFHSVYVFLSKRPEKNPGQKPSRGFTWFPDNKTCRITPQS